MKKILKLKFNKKIQGVLNNLFYDEEYKEYSVGDLVKIFLGNALVTGIFILVSIA